MAQGVILEFRGTTKKGGASNKFWTVNVVGKTMTVHFGKKGTAGQKKAKTFASHDEAVSSAAKLFGEKIDKGYFFPGSTASKEARSKPAKKPATKKPERRAAGARPLRWFMVTAAVSLKANKALMTAILGGTGKEWKSPVVKKAAASLGKIVGKDKPQHHGINLVMHLPRRTAPVARVELNLIYRNKAAADRVLARFKRRGIEVEKTRVSPPRRSRS